MPNVKFNFIFVQGQIPRSRQRQRLHVLRQARQVAHDVVHRLRLAQGQGPPGHRRQLIALRPQPLLQQRRDAGGPGLEGTDLGQRVTKGWTVSSLKRIQ